MLQRNDSAMASGFRAEGAVRILDCRGGSGGPAGASFRVLSLGVYPGLPPRSGGKHFVENGHFGADRALWNAVGSERIAAI